MAKKIGIAVFLGLGFAIWVMLLVLANITQIYKLTPQTLFIVAIFGGFLLSTLSYINPKIYLPILIIYFCAIGISLYWHNMYYFMIIVISPVIILLITLLYKSQIITILSSLCCILFLLFAFLFSYIAIGAMADKKCLFLKNDGHFKPANMTTYSKMLYPIIVQSRIPTGALVILSDTQSPQKRWTLSKTGKSIEIHDFSATLSSETQCELR